MTAIGKLLAHNALQTTAAVGFIVWGRALPTLYSVHSILFLLLWYLVHRTRDYEY